jgi:hypothetical protein
MNSTVRIYDVNTKTCSEIPAAELAPGMIKATIQGREDLGEVYIKAETLKPSGANNRLPDGFEAIALAVLEVLKPRLHWIRTKEDWLDGFRADAHPVRELLLWMWLAAVYHEMTHKGSDSDVIARDVFSVLAASMNDKENPLETVTLNRISRVRAEEIVRRHKCGDHHQRLAEFWAPRIDSHTLTRLMRDEHD